MSNAKLPESPKHFVVLKDGEYFIATNGGELYEYCNHPEFLVVIDASSVNTPH